MIKKVVSKKVIKQCKRCGDKNHSWHEVYYGDRSTLKKVDKIYIAWCAKDKDYVLVNL